MTACLDVTWPVDLRTRCCQLNPLFTINCCTTWAPSKPLALYCIWLFWSLYFLCCINLNIYEIVNYKIVCNTSSDYLNFSSVNPVLICIIRTHWKPAGTKRCHWTDYTGTTLADVPTQRSFRDNSGPICIIWTRCKTTGTTSTLGCHWKHSGWCNLPPSGVPVAIQLNNYSPR